MSTYKNIVIGGSGFVGSVLCRVLAKKGESVLSIAHTKNTDLKSIDQKICDANDTTKLSKLLKGGENIFILIGQNYLGFSKEKELKNIKNIISSIDLVSTKKVFYFSSIHVYGETNSKVKENGYCQPIDDYGKFKLESEKLFQGLKMPVIIVRPTNIYGNPQNRGFIGIVLNKIFQNQELQINDGGKQKKDFMMVDDIVDALIAVLKIAKKSDIVNLSTGKSYPIIEIVKKIEKIIGRKVNYILVDSGARQEVGDSLIDNGKLKNKYQFTPKYNIDNGLRLTYKRYLDYYQKND